MKKKGYEAEVKYIEAVLGWRRACDERGLSELERCRYNYNFLSYILDELMPWHRTHYDFSLLEVNRYYYWGEAGVMYTPIVMTMRLLI